MNTLPVVLPLIIAMCTATATTLVGRFFIQPTRRIHARVADAYKITVYVGMVIALLMTLSLLFTGAPFAIVAPCLGDTVVVVLMGIGGFCLGMSTQPIRCHN